MRIGIMPRCGERNMTGVNKVVQGTCYELLKKTKQNVKSQSLVLT